MNFRGRFLCEVHAILAKSIQTNQTKITEIEKSMRMSVGESNVHLRIFCSFFVFLDLHNICDLICQIVIHERKSRTFSW